MREGPFVRKANNLALATTYLPQSSSEWKPNLLTASQPKCSTGELRLCEVGEMHPLKI